MRRVPVTKNRLFYRMGNTYYCSANDVKTQVSKMADSFPRFSDRGILCIAFQSTKTEYCSRLLRIMIPYCSNDLRPRQIRLTYRVSTVRFRFNDVLFDMNAIKYIKPHLLKNDVVQLAQTVLTPSAVDEASLLSLANGD